MLELTNHPSGHDGGKPPSMLETLSIVRPRIRDRSLKNTIQTCLYLRQQSNRALALYKLSCSICSLNLDSRQPGQYHSFFWNFAKLSALTPGCPFCNIIQQSFEQLMDNQDETTVCAVSCGKKGLDIQLCFRIQDPYCEGQHVQIFSPEPRQIECPFEIRSICSDPKSTTLFDKIATWIDDCAQTHDQCKDPDRTFAPTRLIKISGDNGQDVHLVSSTGPVKYAVLTYCWGPYSQSMTLKANITERHKRLDISLLPQTLQDAIFTTRKLGLEYIWIDSICILQDDRDDWAREAATMAGVYSNGYVVLAATAAAASTQGFLWPRKPPLVVQCAPAVGPSFEVLARRNDTHWCNLDRHSNEYSLFSRAWCMQERYLARRIVHFLPAEVRFECRCYDACECDAVPWPHPEPTSGDDFYRELRAACESGTIGDLEFAGLWNNLTKEYSEMGITHRTDLLPALGGIARSLAPISPGRYLAGLWEKGLAFQLTWYCDDFDMDTTPIQVETLPRPTWSWISSPEKIWPENHYKSPRDKMNALCSLVSSHVQLLRDDPFGEIQSISLTLKGPVVSGPNILHFFAQVAAERTFFLEFSIDAKNKFKAPKMRPETFKQLHALTDWATVKCLGLYTFESRIQGRDVNFVDGLLLQRVPNSSAYARIGIATQMPWALFQKHVSEDVVTVV
ncbi:hypothetical protein ACN47E_008173 [Coniothyrium glycines]